MRRLFVCFLAVLFVRTAGAQAPESMTAAEMYQGIRSLGVLGSVLYVAAHPDDENTRLLAWLSQHRLFRTGYLSLTRGDGGQNLIGEEQGIELGLIRTQELLAARRIDGAEQFFTRAYDFGYSKTPEETLQKWGRNEILADVVWVIRKFRPDVIITRFPVTGEGGHGHHTASAILANEAFEAAADPNRFPEQLKYVEPWQAKRVLWNTFYFGNTNTTSEDQFKIDVGGYNPLLGKSYGEISAESRSQHKSQGFGVPASRGEAFEYFKETRGTRPGTDLLDGVETGWERVKGGEKISGMVKEIYESFDFLHPEKSVYGLVALYRAIENLPSGYWRNRKLEEAKKLILQCGGIWIDAFSPQARAVQGDSVLIRFTVNNRLGVDAKLSGINVNGFDTTLNKTLEKNRNTDLSVRIKVEENKTLTQPYWLREPMQEGSFVVNDQQLIGTPDVEPAYIAGFVLNIQGLSFRVDLPVRYRYTDPVLGDRYQPLVVTPPVLIEPLEKLKLTTGTNEFNGTLNVQAATSAGLIAGVNQVSDKKADANFNPSRLQVESGGATSVLYNVHAASDNEYTFFVSDTQKHRRFQQYLRQLQYDHIPTITYFPETRVINRKLDLVTVGKHIGYITGAGDKVPDALEQMGYIVTYITEQELARNDLGRFDAIIAGVRAYNTNDWLDKYHATLMNYVEKGGNYIVQYNTSNFISRVNGTIGPYPFTISRTRVTDETAPVKFVDPAHQVLNFPNKISQSDFKEWIQERSIYHAASWDDRYETIFSMGDPGERADEGSLIIAKHGKGSFVYTGISFFRELPAGVPGAYRLLANLIALNQQKTF